MRRGIAAMSRFLEKARFLLRAVGTALESVSVIGYAYARGCGCAASLKLGAARPDENHTTSGSSTAW